MSVRRISLTRKRSLVQIQYGPPYFEILSPLVSSAGKSSGVAGRLSRDAGVAGVHGPSAGCSGQSRSLGWVERARALPVRGQGFSHLDQQPQTHRVRPASFRPGERTSAMEEVVMLDRD